MVRIVIVLVLLGHGVGHVLGFLAAWTSLPMGFRDRPWLLGPNVTIQTQVGRAFGVLWLAALAGFIAAAVGLLLGRPWWEAPALGASVVSLIAILPWWNTVPPGPRFWALLLDLALLVGLTGPWQTQIRRLLD